MSGCGVCNSAHSAHSNFDGSSQKGSVVYTECLLAMSLLLYGVEVAVFACVVAWKSLHCQFHHRCLNAEQQVSPYLSVLFSVGGLVVLC